MPDEFIEAVTKFGVISAVVMIGVVLLAICASRTSIGRALLPRRVMEVVSRLLPRGLITDAEASATGEVRVKVTAIGRPRTVHVRLCDDMTIAWTYDAGTEFPQSGTFALTRLRHDLKPGSALSPDKIRARIQKSLTKVLASKRFRPADGKPDLLISVFAAVEDEVSLHTVSEVVDERGGHEWATALRAALQQESVSEGVTFGRGSLVLQIVDSRQAKVLWHAAAMADIVVDVSDTAKERRTRKAIAEMLRRFPPP